MTIAIRLCLGALATIEVIVGAWAQFAPASFYRDFPTVDLTPPYSEHLLRDFGGATLAIALAVHATGAQIVLLVGNLVAGIAFALVAGTLALARNQPRVNP